MKYRRRRYLINTGFQMRIILIFMVVSFLGSLAAVVAFNYFAMKELETLMWSIHIKAQSTGELFKPLFIKTNSISFVFVSILLIIIALWMMRKSSGPIYRMSKDITKAAEGDLTIEIALRNKDEFQDTAQELDRMLKELRERFKCINEKYLEVSGSLTELNTQKAVTADHPSLISNIESIENELSKFKLTKM